LAPAIEHAVIVSGNRDFAPVVKFLQDRGVRVTLISSIRTQPAMISDDLRRQADVFVDLDTLRDDIGREAEASAAA